MVERITAQTESTEVLKHLNLELENACEDYIKTRTEIESLRSKLGLIADRVIEGLRKDDRKWVRFKGYVLSIKSAEERLTCKED